ncbi:MAG: hypothetical protein IKQ95_02650 [Synergistaceae bacterium]|nr:hypothetical protein [Synergistaceae bacterium]
MQYEDEQELSLLDIFSILWRKKWLIFFLTFIFGAAATVYAFTRPFIYRAECRIIPPGGTSSPYGGFATFMGFQPGSSAQRMIGILNGNTVVDAIIDKFNLMEEMSMDIRLMARQAVLGSLEATVDNSSGILSVAYLHTDPQRASDMANAFVEQLQLKMREIAFDDAQEKRLFFENQLMQAQQELADAENAMMKYQQNSGVLALGSQTASLLGSISSLRNQIAAKNVEISSLSSYARQDNPRLKLARSQLEAMTKELHRLEEEQKRTERRQGRATSGDILSSLGNVPELNVEYMRYERALRFATVKYDTMLRQYENAKLSEANDLSTLQIVDPATPPDYKYLPRRARIIVLGAMAGFGLGIIWAFLAEHIRALKKAKEYDYDDE